MAEVHLPMVGGVSKKALTIGGVAAVAVVGIIYIRKRKSGAASSTAATGTTDQYPADGTSGDPTDPYSTDPSTGVTYGDEGGGGAAGSYAAGGQGGYTDPNSGQFVYGNTGTGQAAATTNAAWAQNAIAYLGSNVAVDSALLSTALGLYLAGQPLTSDQIGLVDQAIAVEGYPPTSGTGGYPPGIREAGTSSQGGTGGSGGGVTGSSGAAGAISNLQATGVTKTSFTAHWNPAHGATKGYSYAVTELNGKPVKHGTTHGTSFTASGLTPGFTYNVAVQALPGGPGNNIHVALPKK
jgi:hypothetical protein